MLLCLYQQCLTTNQFFLLLAYKDLDKNLNNIDEVLTKLDQDNDLLQEKLRHLLNTIRIDNTNDQQETQ